MSESTTKTLSDLIAMPESNGLSYKASRFVSEYLLDGNCARARRDSGYSGLSVFPSEPGVYEEIERQRADIARKFRVSAEKIILELARVAFFDPRELYNEDGTLKHITQLSDDVVAGIASMDVEEQGADKDFRTTKKYKFVNKLPALELLAKHLGMFPKESKEITLTGPGGGPIQMSEIPANERARRLAFILNSAIQDKDNTESVEFTEHKPEEA